MRELVTLAGKHVHAHNTDYNMVASASTAYEINHHLTLSAELPYVRRDGLREGTHAHSEGTVWSMASSGSEMSPVSVT